MPPEPVSLTQTQILAATDVLWKALILRPDADPTTVMITVARMLTTALRERPTTAQQARDLDPVLAKRILRG